MPRSSVVMATPPAGSRCRARSARSADWSGSCSILRRSRLTCTSTARSLTEPPEPASARRGTVSPGVAASTASISRSRSVRRTTSSPRRSSARPIWNTNSPKRSDLGRGRGGRLGAPQDTGDAQRQFARLERLGDIIVGADLEPGDAAFRGVARGQHQDRHRGGLADDRWRNRSRSRPASSRRGSGDRSSGSRAWRAPSPRCPRW